MSQGAGDARLAWVGHVPKWDVIPPAAG